MKAIKTSCAQQTAFSLSMHINFQELIASKKKAIETTNE